MSDARSVMKEFRALDHKRHAEGLSADEEARYRELTDLVGSDSSAPGARPGFDVNAAAARLRESLLPAGLRNRPPPTPEPAPEPLPEIEPPTEEAQAIATAYEEQPFTPLPPEGAPTVDALFEPGSLAVDADQGAEASDSSAAPYDPNALYDPNAAAY
ncbi:MAG TPA: chemotaxis protein CheA, partial [Anaeromyxobacter sp.]|nr:chemotaxis protein CheA [Anaeromyxobacter sp.]